MKVIPVQNLDMAHRRFHQGLRGRLAIFFLQVLFQGARVHPDTDRNITIPCRVDHRLNAIFPANIAGIDAQAIDTVLGDLQRDLVIEMNIRHQGNLHLTTNLPKGACRIHGGHGNPYDVGACRLQPLDLGNRGCHVTGLGVGHALHGNRRVAAYGHGAHHDLPGYAPFDRGFTMHTNPASLP